MSAYLSQIIICLAFLGILWLISKVISRNGLSFSKKDSVQRQIEIIDKQFVGKGSMLLVVKFHGKSFLLGATQQKITLIEKENISEEKNQYEN